MIFLKRGKRRKEVEHILQEFDGIPNSVENMLLLQLLSKMLVSNAKRRRVGDNVPEQVLGRQP